MAVSLSAEDIRSVATWPLIIAALREGHRRPPADIGDTLVGAGENRMLVRSAWIDGLAAGVKAATVVPANVRRSEPLPSIHAQVMLFDTDTGQLTAWVDGTAVTAWKTAADSALGSDLLSRPDSQNLLMVGAGGMAEPLIRAHCAVRPDLKKVTIWNRNSGRAEDLRSRLGDLRAAVSVADDLDAAIAEADIISCATMAVDPVLKGAIVRPGSHVDLVGAYRLDMREADDDLHRRGEWFVDSRETTLEHIGELKIPLEAGLIDSGAVLGDLHALVDGTAGRSGDEAITVFKNGGGAHLDIMVSTALVEAWRGRNGGGG